MRLPRFAIVIAVLGTPVVAVAATSSSVAAEPLHYTQVSVATRGACALSADGTVVCWGDNPDRWVIADRPAGAVPTPTKISLPNGMKWKSINAGEAYANCGIAENDRAYCWGNHHIGSYFTTTSRTPVEVEFPEDIRVAEIQSGHSTACARTTTNELWCWGDAQYLGDGSIDPVRVPVRITLPDNGATRSFAAGSQNTCVVTEHNNMYCWGNNASGEFGLGYARQYSYPYSWTPVLIPAPANETWATPSVGLNRICAITNAGAGYCAGDNYQGVFGNGTYDDSMRFTKMVIPNDERIISIATGWYHTCVGTESGKTWCVGRGDYGELGTGTTLGGRTWRTPLAPAGVRFVSFDAGVAGTCALDSTGRVWCWGGLNWGSQGTGRVNAGLSPELIAAVGSPTVVTTNSTSVDAEFASVTGEVNPNGYVSSVVVEVSTSQNFASAIRRTVTASFPSDVYVARPFSVTFTALEPRTTYYARTIATNTFGSVIGNIATFATLGEEPTVGEVTASNLTGNEASLAVSLRANRLTTSAYFEVSTEEDFSLNLTRFDTESLAGTSDVLRHISLSNLQPRTRYYTRAIATNRLGTTIGNANSFVTVGERPTVSITSISSTISRIELVSLLDSGLARGTVYAEASTSPSFTSPIRSSQQLFTSRTNGFFTFTLQNLSPQTDYWVRVIADNGVGTSTTQPRIQRTRGGAPSIRVSNVVAEPQRATATVVVDSTGVETFSKIQLSQNADLSDATEFFISSSASDTEQQFFIPLTNLLPGTAYYVAAYAKNQFGEAVTSTTSFVTPRPLGVVINNDSDDTDSATVSLTITAPHGAVAYRVSNHASFRNAQVFSPSSPLRWELIASDEAEESRTVYVQVYLSNGTSVVYSDSIILITDVEIPDEEAPIVQMLRAPRVVASAQTASTRSSTPRLSLSVRDRRSGVTRIEIKVGRRTLVKRVDKTRQGTYSITVPRGSKTVVVRVRDAAGNYSKWKRMTIR